MSELIPITTDSEGIQAVKGRDLHAFLESKEPYTRWLSRHIEKYGFIAGQDFMTEMSESTGGRPAENHILTMSMAKELAMLQGNRRGKQAREYFIECEKRAKQRSFNPNDITRLEIAQMLVNAETERLALEAQNKELTPKAEAYDSFLDTTGKSSSLPAPGVTPRTRNIFTILKLSPTSMSAVMESRGAPTRLMCSPRGLISSAASLASRPLTRSSQASQLIFRTRFHHDD